MRIAKEFLQDVFHCHVETVAAPRFPRLVDVLSTIDLAIDRSDHLGEHYDPSELREVRAAFEYAIFRCVESSLRRDEPATALLALAAAVEPGAAVIISMNYDTLIDEALAQCWADGAGGVPLDYGLRFANVAATDRPDTQLLKLHGSFNWLFSGIDGELYLCESTEQLEQLFSKSRRVVEVPDFRPEATHSIVLPVRWLRPMLVTPTFAKDLRNPHAVALWAQAAAAVGRTNRLTFIGYSLPDDDIEARYMFKRARHYPHICVVDPNPAVVTTYERFFGRVDEHHADFEEFAAGLSGRAG